MDIVMKTTLQMNHSTRTPVTGTAGIVAKLRVMTPTASTYVVLLVIFALIQTWTNVKWRTSITWVMVIVTAMTTILLHVPGTAVIVAPTNVLILRPIHVDTIHMIVLTPVPIVGQQSVRFPTDAMSTSHRT
jgi:cell division protein FtsW (lipid II flippase)